MPIHKDWSSMISNMRSQYCSKGDKTVSRDMSDGSKVSMCKKGWSVFFATMRKKGWKETKSHGGKVTSETFALAVEETVQDIVGWYKEQLPVGGVIGAKQNPMEIRSGKPSEDGRKFALTDDSKTKAIIEYFETKYKPKDDCGCGCDDDE